MTKLNNLISFLLIVLFTSGAFADVMKFSKRGPSDEMIEYMAKHNQKLSLTSKMRFDDSQKIPFYEWDHTEYILMSDDDYWGIATEMKELIASNLPDSAKLVIYTQSKNPRYINQLKENYLNFISEDRLIVLQVPESGSNDFWTRDNLPFPIWKDGRAALVDAKYYYNFEPDIFLGEHYSVDLLQHEYFYEGGNFITNSLGDCVVVNRRKRYPGGLSDTAAIPDSIFYNMYGCRSLLRFEHLKGIGHSDEVVKFLSDDIVVTDTEAYVSRLEAAGFEVYLLPEPQYEYETYINSLIVNDTVYVPVFNEFGDTEALETYKKILPEYKIVPVQSRQLATRGQGGIHCITMNYPKMPLEELAESLDAKVY